MPEKTKDVSPPTGLAAFFFRLPIWLYKIGLGWLLGGRFLLINHIGRKSGKIRQVVVEVVRHDAETDSYIVAVGFGEKSQWYQNLQHQPDVTIQVGRRKLAVTADFLSEEQGADEMADYGRRHPGTARELSRVMGYKVDGSESDYRAMGRLIPFIAFRPDTAKLI
ncbi:MAG: nitroreductase family deazaflavin-dependent oxidoreductase [Candidatus Promineifilaceae bacterium]